MRLQDLETGHCSWLLMRFREKCEPVFRPEPTFNNDLGSSELVTPELHLDQFSFSSERRTDLKLHLCSGDGARFCRFGHEVFPVGLERLDIAADVCDDLLDPVPLDCLISGIHHSACIE